MTIVDDSGNEVLRKAAEVIDPATYALRTSSVGGAGHPTGLNNGGLMTEVEINATTWTALPPAPLLNRNAISIQNSSNLEIKINYRDDIVGYVGMVMVAGGERFYDITDAIQIYAKSLSGTPTINVEELS